MTPSSAGVTVSTFRPSPACWGCCAAPVGAGGEEHQWLAAWANLDMQLVAYVPTDRQGMPTPRQPLLRDFHMVGSGYDDQDPWQSLLIPKTSEGKKAVGGGTKMTYRYYLQDMAYAVLLQAPAALVDEVSRALRKPGLGSLPRPEKLRADRVHLPGASLTARSRPCRPPSNWPRRKTDAFSLRVLQGEHEGEVLTLNDVPLQFGAAQAIP